MNQVWLSVRVHPGAKKEMLVMMGTSRFEAWVRAKPHNGQANEALVALLSRYLRVAPARVQLVKGHSGRSKLFTVVQ